MKDRAGLFAGCADTLTAMCVYYFVAGILIISRERWGVHLLWLLLLPAAYTWLYAWLLRKPRGTPLLAAVTGALALAAMGVFLLVSRTPLYFGYLFVLLVGAGMAAGLPLYYTLKRPLIHRHLTHLDVLIVALGAVILCRDVLHIDGATVALMIAVLLMDAAGAIGLRMSDGTQNAGRAFQGTLVALTAATAVGLLIALFSAIFSRSGAVTDGVLGGLGSFFAMLGGGLERFFRWLSSLVTVHDDYGVLELEEMPSVAALENQTVNDGFSANAQALGIALVILALAAAVAVVLILRKKRVSRGADAMTVSAEMPVRRTGGTAGALWDRLVRALRFRWRAFMHRNTPGGLLVTLERLGKRRRTPRRTGESMRQFIRRMDGSGGLDALSDALDREYYGGAERAMSAKTCRAMRKYMKKAVQHG